MSDFDAIDALLASARQEVPCRPPRNGVPCAKG